MSRYDEKELMRLVDLEYERTAKFIDGITTTAATIRGWAVTIWLAVIGVSFERASWELAGLAAVVALVFLVIDGYHAWLYGEALIRANELERIEAAHYANRGRRSSDPDAPRDLRDRLQGHRFGLYRNFKRFRFRDLLYVRPVVFFRVFYPFLMVTAAVAALLIATQHSNNRPSCEVVTGTGGRAVQCGDVIVVNGRATRLP